MKKIVFISLLFMSSVRGDSGDLFNLSQSKFTELYEFITRGGVVFDILDKTNAIKTKTDTLKISLSQDLVDPISNSIILDTTGTYILVDNIFADFAITGTNVTLDLAGKSIIGTVNVSGSTTIIKNGAIVALPPFTPAYATAAALTIGATGTMVRVKECHINCFSSVQVIPGFDQVIPGRNAIEISGAVVDIVSCSIGAGTSASTTTTTAGDGGTAILIDGLANKVRIFDCIMVSGNGGTAAVGNGGNGGHGIHIKDNASLIEIRDCSIFEMGNGGTPNGNGGHGILIESGVLGVGVYGCTIRNTGIGDGAGVGGKAIWDMVTDPTGHSIIYRNVAYYIANSLKFDLQGAGIEKGVSSPTPPDGTVLNPLANIYFS